MRFYSLHKENVRYYFHQPQCDNSSKGQLFIDKVRIRCSCLACNTGMCVFIVKGVCLPPNPLPKKNMIKKNLRTLGRSTMRSLCIDYAYIPSAP